MLGWLKKLFGVSAKKIEQAEPKPKSDKEKAVSVTVGLDFGTSSTKCVVNLEGYENHEDKFLVIAFPSQKPSETTLCIPTSIAVQGNCLVFGESAEQLPESCVIRSFKMAIPCIGKKWGNYQSALMIPEKPGFFDIQGNQLSAVDLGILYLANVIRQVKSQLKRYLPTHMSVQVYLNLAAPLNQLKCETTTTKSKNKLSIRDSALSRHYIGLGQRSLRLSDSSQNPWPLEEAIQALEDIKSKPLLSFQESPAYVVPETLAAIRSYINRPRTRSNHFMTFDVGAGSTDTSIFWLEKHEGSIKPWYYVSASLHIGMDSVDRSLCSVTHTREGRSPRERREDLQQHDGRLSP